MRILIFVLLSVFNFSAFGGDGSTSVEDGGHGVKCTEVSGSVGYPANERQYRVELLDFYEGRKVDKLIYGGLAEPMGNWVLMPASRRILCETLQEFFVRTSGVLRSNILSAAFEDACQLSDKIQIRDTLPTTKDFGALTAKIQSRRCKLVQIGYRTIDKGREVVLLNGQLLPGLSEREVAGLLLHEALHKYFPNKTSTQAIRQIVFYSFAHHRFQVENRDLISRVISTGMPANKLEFK